ncbi:MULTISPECIES: DNA cytosine methyltransferase [Marinobacter]|uniref:DNA cytosine methyltransferase n=1 Tax=Marinobacter TaxID=2742 RepID=UPI002943C749|nr:DNA cytosine methyltransferase [Marinobacter salarius]WOI20922.1 DNA cytosine methyltransferase [Marinobacter salarius]
MAKNKRKITGESPIAADLFCGSGSVSAALASAGFRVAFAIDNDDSAKATYTKNHPSTLFFGQDIGDVDPLDAKGSLQGRPLSILAVCAPCQPFSSQNRKRNKADQRAPLVLEALRFAKALKPETIWVENVPGIVRSEAKQELREGLSKLGYSFSDPIRVSATDLGVPQRRFRSIFVASKSDFVLKRFESLRTTPSVITPPTVRMAFSGLKPVGLGEQCPIDPLHRARRHSPITIQRLRAIPKDGGSRAALPENLQLACHRNLQAKSFPDVYGRMAWDLPSPTLTTGCTDVTRGRFAHPEQDRAITLREAARLQTFPDSYSFEGTHTQIARLIGNAVPYEMARQIFLRLFSEEVPAQICGA